MLKKKVIHAPFGYYGSKANMLEWIHNNLPPARKFLDVFGGSGAVCLSLVGKYNQMVYNDINHRLVNFFETLRNHPDELIWKINNTPSAKEEYDRCKSISEDRIEDARRVYVLINQSWMRQGLAGAEWQFYGLGGPSNSSARTFESKKKRLPGIAEALKSIDIHCVDWRKLIPGATKDTLIFADPPYDLSARVGGKGYAYEMTEQDHIDLAKMLSESPAQSVVCGYNSDLYKDLYKDWSSVEKEVNRNVKNTLQSKANGKRVEVMWIKKHDEIESYTLS